MRTLHSSTPLILTFLLISSTISTIIVPKGPLEPLRTSFDESDSNIVSARRLQSTEIATLKSGQIFKNLLTQINQDRSAKSLPALTQNNRLDQVLAQWYDRKAMKIVPYLQLMGILNVQLYQFDQLPLDYLSSIIKEQCQACFKKQYTEIAGLIRELDNGEHYVIIGVIGGYDVVIKNYESTDIINIVQTIDQKNNKVQVQNGTAIENNQNSSIEQTQINENQKVQNSLTKIQNSSAQIIQNPVNNNQSASSVGQISQPTVAPEIPQITQNPQIPQVPVIPLPSQKTEVNATQNTQPQGLQLEAPPIQNLSNLTIPQPPAPKSTRPFIDNYGYMLPSALRNQQQNTNFPSEAPPQKPEPQTIVVTPVITQSTPIVSNSKPLVAQKDFGTTPFSDLTLDHNIPAAFLKGQTFVFRGSLKIPNPSGTFVNVIFTRRTDSQKMSFSQYVKPNERVFAVEAQLNISGDFFIAIFSGYRGAALRQLFTVEERFVGRFVSRSPNQVRNAYLEMKQNDLYLQWTHNDILQPGITQLVFIQGSQILTFVLSNYVSSFLIPYEKFASFQTGMIKISVSQAFSNTESANSRTSEYSQSFDFEANAVQHNFASTKKDSGIDPFNFKIARGQSIYLTGTSSTPVKNDVILQTPYRTFETYLIDNSQSKYATLRSGTNINMRIPFNRDGVYILEVNNAEGQAIINVPVYVGDKWPFLPDFRDLSDKKYDTRALNYPSDIVSRRKLVLDLVNIARQRFGVDPIVGDARLDNLAQDHSQNMINQNFFGHVDPQGRSPSQRAKQAGIIEGVGENIAMNLNLTEAQLSLERSPAHLRNMVKDTWTRVGLGIAQNSKGYYYLSQQFSSRDLTVNPLSVQQMGAIQQQLVNHMLQKYPKLKYEDTQVSKLLSEYQNDVSVGNIGTFLRSRGINRNMMLINMVVSYNGGDYMELVERTSNYNIGNSNYNRIGLTVAFKGGMLEVFGAIS